MSHSGVLHHSIENRMDSDTSAAAMMLKLSQLDLGTKKANSLINSSSSSNNNMHYAQQNNSSKSFIPPIPESYCFVDENFHSDAFSVDGFVKRNSKRVHSLEKLKEELTAYLKILKHSMIDLINEDYTEFINLSANLISFDKSINNIKTPVLKFKDETSHVQSRIEDIIVQLTAKQSRLRTIRDNKLRINMILEISTHLSRVEANIAQVGASSMKLGFASEDAEQAILSGVDSVLDENATLISRIQMNFDYLLSNGDIPDKNSNNHLLAKLKQRFDVCSRQFYNSLERKIYYLLSYDIGKLNDEAKLNAITRWVEKIIRIYLLSDNQKELERIICHDLVRPTFDLYICDSYITKNGAQSMFEKILDFIDTKCALLIKVLTSAPLAKPQSNDEDSSPSLSTLGYELLTRTLWKEFVDDCMVRASALFSLANADSFYRNYALTFRFIEDFLYKTSLIEYRDRFENETSYHQLKAKFNLNVYFFMKLQQIVPSIEKGFNELRFSFSATPNASQYRTNVTALVHDNLFKCWQAGDSSRQLYVGDLFGYLWKISLKIVARFASWIASVSTDKIAEWLRTSNASTDFATEKRVINHTLAALIFDCQQLIANFTSLYQSVITPLWSNYIGRLQVRIEKQNASRRTAINRSSLDTSFGEAITSFYQVAIKHLVRLMKNEIIQECIPILDLVNDIPRLYRRTNKEKPGKASTYIVKCCQQLHELIALIGLERSESWKQEWMAELLTDLTLHYKNATLEVLTSVQKTEDSLKKLKKAKPIANRNLSSSMSDDDKIRLQIYYDVLELGTEIQNKLSLDLRSIKPYHELSEMVSSLKILI